MVSIKGLEQLIPFALDWNIKKANHSDTTICFAFMVHTTTKCPNIKIASLNSNISYLAAKLVKHQTPGSISAMYLFRVFHHLSSSFLKKKKKKDI